MLIFCLVDAILYIMVGAKQCPSNLSSLGILADASIQIFRVSSTDVDHVGIINAKGSPDVLCCDDGVTYDTVSPLQLVEYCFSEGSVAGRLMRIRW